MLKKSRYILLLLPVGLFFKTYFSIPDYISVPQNSKYELKIHSLCKASSKYVSVSENGEALFSKSKNGIDINTDNIGNYSIDVKMFNIIPVKTVNVNVAQQRYVIPSGSPLGIKIYSDGLLVVNVCKMKTYSGKNISPAEEAGIKIGDRVISANGKKVNLSEELARIIGETKENVELEVVRGEEIMKFSIMPEISEDGQNKKLGMWVRDSTAGVGTLTFFEPETNVFATLGHGITDVDTGDMVLPKSGTISKCKITYTKKSINGTPGELSGVFEEESIGNIYMNSYMGVYGKIQDSEGLNNAGYMPAATRFQIKNGPAYILTDVDGEGVKKYSIEIEEVSKKSTIDNKGMVIHITDEELLRKTGGIVQGMSGAPIIQNDMLVGAVTHVFINDPQRGYGVFIENMIDASERVK